VELLVVVIVIGILAAIAIPSYLGQRRNAYLASLTQDLRTAVVAVESGGITTGSYLSLDGADESTAALLGFGYSGGSLTAIAVQASATTYCIEATDSRVPGVYLTARSGTAGYTESGLGC
jgi:type IV pilus assembly protein PilA